MVKNIIRIAIVLLVLHAGYRFGIAILHYEEFKDAVQQLALFSKEQDDGAFVDRVMEIAAQYEIPLDRDAVRVQRGPERTSIEASYVEMIEWLPGYRRPWQFDVNAEAMHLQVR